MTPKKWFFAMLIPALVGFAGVWLMRKFGGIDPGGQARVLGWAPVLFILAVVTAIAAPILIRTGFAHRMRKRSQIAEEEFLRFQRHLILVVMATPYLALAAYTLDAPRFYLAGSLLAMFYTLYYHYPSQRRLSFDRRIFRVR